MASFFTPASQKPKSRVTWEERAPVDGSPTSLLVAKYTPEQDAKPRGGTRKIAAFDLVCLRGRSQALRSLANTALTTRTTP